MADARILWGVGTTRTLRAHWMLRELDLPYETRPIGPRSGETRTPEFVRLNPRGKIPVLQDGDLTLAESAAIVTYLAERYGDGTGLIPPSGTPERARYYQSCFHTMTELDAHTLYVIRKHRDLAELYGEAPKAVEAAREGFARQLAAARSELERGGPFLLGDAFTGADVMFTSCLDWAIFYELPLPEPLAAYRARTTAREAYRSAAALNYRPPAA